MGDTKPAFAVPQAGNGQPSCSVVDQNAGALRQVFGHLAAGLATTQMGQLVKQAVLALRGGYGPLADAS